MNTSQNDSNRLVTVLLLVGILSTISALVFVFEYSLLNAEMSLIEQKLELAIENQVGNGSVLAYITAIALWTVLLGAVGWVWSRVLYPTAPVLERLMVALGMGTFVMPLIIVIPTWIVSARKLMTDWFGYELPAYYGTTVGKVVGLFSTNQEQGYELVAILLFLAVGLVLWGFRRLSSPKN